MCLNSLLVGKKLVVIVFMGMPKIQAVGTAVPTYGLEQEEIKKFIAALFHSHIDHLDRLLPVFENSCIRVRHFSQPLE
ncbi:MAG: stilbene synthase, partial [Sporomusaceae bacterium]|nr:stilbene synthase [Sporomusaceae bacterium]